MFEVQGVTGPIFDVNEYQIHTIDIYDKLIKIFIVMGKSI